ncbi:hypothetical protein QR680_015462 [Steinernema hermaphroditum]|uniref:Uncharacterized protein n=1 Tax=Steinernema hermaphroditum TaxID=289476 RepID=A0AA39H7R8_9BILA|nr:hypothetical protein QR680_015462 [Steinernema hermaphroditum]
MSGATFDILADITNLVPIPFKMFCMYVVYRHSPANMESLPLFILNVMMWELLASIFAAIEHSLPYVPYHCYHIDGLINLFTNNEIVYHIIAAFSIMTRMNSSLGQVFIFPYRYLTIAFPERTSKINRKWVFAFCACLHVMYIIAFFAAYANVIGFYDEYPFGGKPPKKKEIMCSNSNVWLRDTWNIFFTAFTFTSAGVIVGFSLLLVHHFHKMVHLYNEQTLKMHRKFLRYLIVITAVPVACGLLPHAISALNNMFFPRYALEIVIGTIVMIYIDSTLFFVVCIFAFAPYRQAVARMRCAAFAKSNVISVPSISVSL